MEEAEIRMEIYLSLAIAFGRPGRQRFCQQNEGSFLTFLLPQTRAYLLSEFRKPTLQLFSFIKQNAEQMDDQFWQNLEIEYNRLFVGPYSPKAPPYESKYTNPSQQMLNSCRVCLLEDYGQENLNLKQDFYDLPDHIVVELEFMALLCEKELHARINHNTEKALKYLLKQYDFLVNHLSKWCSEFSKEIASKSKSILYHSLAVLLRDFISDDLEKLRDEIYKLEVKVLNSPTQSQHKKDRMLLIHKKIKTEEAEYSIEINSADCILCGVCVSCCPTNAFRMNNSQRRI
ncbi:MAG: molecular chaperone TorD family protein, partial [bacterium]